MTIKNRKIEHLSICKNFDVEKNDPLFDDLKLIHKATPELNKQDIETETVFLDKEIDFPFIIPAITGGHPDLVEINKRLAEVAEELNIGIGVGSQRAAIENEKLRKSLTIVAKEAPSTLKIANLGAPQFSRNYGIKEAKKAIEMIDADALAIHLNFLQEAIQLEGETESKGLLTKIKNINEELDEPIIVKETGAGISREVATKLNEIDIKAIDVSGKGGTSWPWVEKIRANNENNFLKKKLGENFSDWGIPTAASIVEADVGPEIMASGGVRTGKDVAKSLVLGADVAGAALPLIKPVSESKKSLKKKLNLIKEEIILSMFLTGSKDIEELKKSSFVLKDNLKNWINQRKLL